DHLADADAQRAFRAQVQAITAETLIEHVSAEYLRTRAVRAGPRRRVIARAERDGAATDALHEQAEIGVARQHVVEGVQADHRIERVTRVEPHEAALGRAAPARTQPVQERDRGVHAGAAALAETEVFGARRLQGRVFLQELFQRRQIQRKNAFLRGRAFFGNVTGTFVAVLVH